MFENLGWPEILVLLLLAMFIFGPDKLPKLINDGVQMLRQLRRMATNATTDLSRELGTDVRLEDLHPKTFIRKHLLSEEDEQALRRPIEQLYRGVRDDVEGLRGELDDVRSAVDPHVPNQNGTQARNGATGATGTTGAAPAQPGVGGAAGPGGSPAPARAEGYDADAT